MKPETFEHTVERHIEAVRRLAFDGFVPRGWMFFEKNGILYDLSAADLNQVDRIEREGLCVVATEPCFA